MKNTECVYQLSAAESMKQKLAELENSKAAHEILHALQTRGEAEAAAIFFRIRTGVDTQVILKQIKEGDLLLQLRLIPESRRRYSFPCESEMPAHLRAVDNPYLQSPLYEWTGIEVEESRPPSSATGLAQYMKPYHASMLADPRFDRVVPSRWTTVSTDDDLMREILKAHFQFEYPCTTFFHVDCFLDDMIAGRGQSCSSLLVNTVLAAGCVSHTHTILENC